MFKIPTDTIVPVLKHALGEYKYLSPNVYKIKNGYNSNIFANSKNVWILLIAKDSIF